MGLFWQHFETMLGSCWGHFGINLGHFWNRFGIILGWMFGVWCSMFGCSMFDVMFGQADVMLCYCWTYDLLVFEGVFDLTFVSVRLTLSSAGPES